MRRMIKDAGHADQNRTIFRFHEIGCMMQAFPAESDRIRVRLAGNAHEIDAAQHLRYKVFYEERQARADAQTSSSLRDKDDFDSIADHLVVTDGARGGGADSIVGTYRLLRQDVAMRHGGFYSAQEFDISPLARSGARLLELGRSCVLAPYRTRPVLQKLWQGIASYVMEHQIGLMFGCASFQGTDVQALSVPLAYLHHYHLAPEGLRPRALDSRFISMDLHPHEAIDPKTAFAALPPLIKGYLRLGAHVGEGAVVDQAFNTTDVCIVLQTHLVTARYLDHYERTIGLRVCGRESSPPPAPSRSRPRHDSPSLVQQVVA